MADLATTLSLELKSNGLAVYETDLGMTQSHQVAIEAAAFGGGQTATKTLRKAGFLSCGVGLQIASLPDDLDGLRIGTPELVRWGVTAHDIPALASLITEALRSNAPETIAPPEPPPCAANSWGSTI